MKKRKKTDLVLDASDIQESGNILLDRKLELIRKKFLDLKIIKTSEEHQKDRGVDFQIELVNRTNNKTIDLFKLQVKATNEQLVPLRTTSNKGLISFQLSNKHILYYQNEIPVALLFLLCDETADEVYWYAIQLDDSLEDRVNESLAKNHDSIQIFVNPANKLDPDNFLEFIEQAEQSKNTQFFRASDERVNPLTTNKDFEVDRGKPLLQQLFEFMEYMYEEVRYLPIHLLTQHYPFKISNAFTPYYHWFHLYTDNIQLVEMLKSFEVTDGKVNFSNESFITGVDDYEEKATSILRKLTQNHIYSVSAQKSGKEASTRLFQNQTCDCVACRYYRLDIPGAILQLNKTKKGDLDEQMKVAYMHYKLGNYLQAAKAFKAIGIESKKKNKKTLFLITQFNLQKLGRLIKNSYYDSENQSYAQRLMQINLERAVFAAQNKSHHRKLFNWIKEVRFYSDNAFEIQASVSQLRNDHQAYLRGSIGTSRNYDQMLNGFAQLHSFVNSNYIVYDRYSEYKLQVEEFTEGIFAALSLRETNSRVLTELVDYHIHRLIFDGDHKITWRYFNKYNFKSVPYKQSDGNDNFLALVVNLLKNNSLMKTSFQNYTPEEGGFWRNSYPAIFCNCLCVASILRLDPDDVTIITRGIMDCYAADDLPSIDAHHQVNSFLSTKKKQISTNLLKELIYFFLPFNDQYLQQRLAILTTELKSRRETIVLATDQEARVFDYSFVVQDQKNFNTVLYFHAIAEPALKKRIETSVLLFLRDNFDTYQFYHAVIIDVIPFLDSEFSERFINATYPDPSKSSFRQSFYGPEDNAYPLFDMLFNICFKFNLVPTQISDREFCGFGDYYDWLLDVDGFDYTKFKIGWLLLYPTKFYLEKFRKHEVVKTKVETFLRSNRDIRIERLYFDLYLPEDTDIHEDYLE